MIKVFTSYETLEYKTPVPVRLKTLTSNTFLKVSVLENPYYFSVLPGLHNSTLQELEFAIINFFTFNNLDFTHIDLNKPFFNLVKNPASVPNGEILFCIETILLGLLKTTHPEVIHINPIKLSGLYSSVNSLDHYSAFQCLKIKITPLNVSEVATIMTNLFKQNPETKFRLDGNRRFELNDLLEFIETLKNLVSINVFKQIDYIEEPFKNFYDTYTFESRSDLKIAMDESFPAFMNQENFMDRPVVIKPSLIGLSSVSFWLRNHSYNRAIMSSTFEHPTVSIGHHWLANSRPEEYHGLENFL